MFALKSERVRECDVRWEEREKHGIGRKMKIIYCAIYKRYRAIFFFLETLPTSFAEGESKDEAASQRRQGGYTCCRM